jgi:phosphatidylinositol alpha-mannosyltransferase
MKIGLVCPYNLFSPGGVKEHVLALYQEFKKKGHQVKIMAPKTKSSQNPDFFLLGLSAPFPSATGSWGRVSASFEERALKKYLQRERFAVLHFHEPLAPFLSWQLLLASQTINVATFHSAWEEKKSLTNTFEFLIKPLAEVFEDRLSGLIAVSPACKQSWQKFLKKKMTIVPNGVSLSRFSPRIERIKKFNDGKINLLFVGRLERRKGLVYLLRALARLRNKEVRLMVVGSGPRKIEADVFARSQRLPNVEFIGRVSDKDLPRYYATADICCFPSIGGESFGIVLLEAMASGKPIICFANPGYKEVLKDYPFQRGLVKPEDVDGLALSLKSLISSKSLREKLGGWGLKEVKKYAWPQIAKQVLNFYQKFTS